MHAQSGTVGSQEFQESTTFEIVLTLRTPNSLIIEESGTPEAHLAALDAILVEEATEFASMGIEVGVRSRIL